METQLNTLNKFAFIEGDKTLCSDDLITMYKYLVSSGEKPLVLTNIYDLPRQLDQIKEKQIETIIIQTTAINPKFGDILKYFDLMDYEPKNLVLLFASTEIEFNLITNKYPDMKVWQVWDIEEDFVEIEEM